MSGIFITGNSILADVGAGVSSWGDLKNIPKSVVNYEVNEVPLIFILGEKNANGLGNTDDLPGLNLDFSGSEVKIWDVSLTPNPETKFINRFNTGTWKDYAVSDMVVSASAPGKQFGVELSLAIRWRDEHFERTGKSLYIIKCGMPNSSLYQTASIDGDWSDKEDGLRQLVTADYSVEAIRRLQSEGLQPICLGFIWIQGESDVGSASTADNYLSNLQAFSSGIKKDIGFTNARTIVVELNNNYDTLPSSTVKNAQKTLSNDDENSVIINTDGTGEYLKIATKEGNNTEYDSQGIITLGNLCVDNLDFTGEKIDITSVNYNNSGSTARYCPPVFSESITPEDTYGSLAALQYPTASTANSAITWVKTGDTLVRPANNTTPAPRFMFNDVSGEDGEIVFRMVHDGDINTKAGIIFRSTNTNNSSWTSYCILIYDGGTKLSLYRNENSQLFLFNNYPLTIPATTNEPYWFKFRWVGVGIESSSSPDGQNWTLHKRSVTGSYSTGECGVILFEGYCDKQIGSIKSAHCAFDIMYARNWNL